MPSIPVPPMATTEGLAASTGGGQTASVNPQQQQPTQPVWGGLLSKMYPTQKRTMNFPPGSSKTTPLGSAQFGQAFGIMKGKSAAVTKRPWIINGADAMTSMQYYSRKRKDGSQGRASVTMPASTDKSRGEVAKKAEELSPFAQGFVQRCVDVGLTEDLTKQAAARLCATLPALEVDLAPVVKSAGLWTNLVRGAGTLASKVPGVGNVWSKAKGVNKAVSAVPKYWSSGVRAAGDAVANTGANPWSALKSVQNIGSGALQGLGVGGLADTAYAIGTGGEVPSWGSLAGLAIGGATGSRRFQKGFKKLLPGVHSAFQDPNSGVRKTLGTAARWGIPIEAGHYIGQQAGHRAVSTGLEQAAQQSGFSNFEEMQQLAQQYNNGDVIGLVKGLWGKMSPEAKMALLGAGAMAGGGLLSAATNSATPAQFGAMGGAGLMAPAAIKHVFGATPWAQSTQTAAAPAQPPQTAPAYASNQLRARNEYQYQLPGNAQGYGQESYQS